MKKDYFAILGLKPSASDKEIRAAYKRLARKHHPDFNPGDQKAEEKFKEISEAYAVLSDPEKRRKWESGDFDFESFFRGSGTGGGRAAPSFEEMFGGEGGGLGSVLEDLFGGAAGAGAPGQGRERGADLQYETTVSFEDAVIGTSLRIPLARTVACATCGGEGFLKTGRPAACPRCGGTGRLAMGGGFIRMAAPCPDCGGTGRRPGEACRTCGGNGTQRSAETIEVRIPPGVDDGAKVRVAGKGEAGRRGGPPGDLYVLLKVAPHRYFRREGGDVVLDVPLSVVEAALGTRIEVPTVTGRVTLTVPPGSRSGQRLRLRGRGAPARRGGGAAGDQIVVLQIVTPRTLDDRSRRMLEEFRRLNPEDPRAGLGW